ncbi:MAG: hypothetical protein QOG85_1767 [Gaiellaceae bacterium]|jgi:ElaB/YqjD/DUF883 family membrane-anchored ribosome-binding protein|nr:hypothetical protein [Gaiellaceae bacterium]
MASDEFRTAQPAPAPSSGVGGTATEAVEKVQAQASQATARAAEQVRSQVDSRSTQAAARITPLARALQGAGDDLQREGNDTEARAAYRIAGQVESLAGYLRASNSDRFLGDVEQFARRRPWVAGGLAAATGFMAARFLRASAESRYGAAGYTNPSGDHDWPMTRETGTTMSTPPQSVPASPGPEY